MSEKGNAGRQLRLWHRTGEEDAPGSNASNKTFPTLYADILQRIDQVNPLQYARTRNYLRGAVTRLSPYISRGVISTRMVFDNVKARGYAWPAIEKFVSELAWRDFFQRVWQAKGEAILQDLRQPQPGVLTYELPVAIDRAATGIEAIDEAIRELKATGYMHNHLRMYTASIACNIAGAHWKAPATWMYYHLLDGDIGSNHLSWQWVASAFSGKKYYCNQENINRYTGSKQQDTYLDKPYEQLPPATIPDALLETVDPNLQTQMPAREPPVVDPSLPLLLYNYYNLDPAWRSNEPANRILLLEPSHFSKYPAGSWPLEFAIRLARQNIPGIQVFAGELDALPHLRQVPAVISKEHPAFMHYPGHKDPRDWLCPEISGYFPSFFAYWKKLEPRLRKEIAR